MTPATPPRPPLDPAVEAVALAALRPLAPGARVAVAMSGGVDSSLVAALVARAGYEVVGLTLRLGPSGEGAGEGPARAGACCAGADARDAAAVAARFGFPHYVLDFEARFREAVAAPFAAAYLAGRTPVPCVACNRRLKFEDLLDLALDLGADAMATGHYVASRPLPGGGRALHRALDPARDQSHFLHATAPAQLARLRFPLGDLPKSAVRAAARALGLGVADKPDSQDLCFVPDGRTADAVERLAPGAARPGAVRHLDGRALGAHGGVHRFTVGQRRGLGVAGPAPLHVVRLDAARAEVVVGPRAALAVRRVLLDDVTWLGDAPLAALPPEGLALAARPRSTRPPAPARLFARPGGALVVFARDEEGVAPGQSVSLYADEGPRARVLGGGTVVSAEAADDEAPAAEVIAAEAAA